MINGNVITKRFFGEFSCELAKRYFEIERESERQLTEENNGEFDRDSARSMHEELWEKQSREYLSLKEEVKASQDRYEIGG